jgi:hypothetical protein
MFVLKKCNANKKKVYGIKEGRLTLRVSITTVAQIYHASQLLRGSIL